MSKYEHKSAKDKAFEKERIQFRHRIHDLEAENKQLRQTIRKQTDAIETLNDQLRSKEEWIERLLTYMDLTPEEFQTLREQAKETKAASDAIKDTSDLINHLFVGAFGHLL